MISILTTPVRDSWRDSPTSRPHTGGGRSASPAHKPGLALLDPLLPRIGGIERLEQDPDLRDRPVIFISAYGRNEAIVRALGTSAADCIVKPLSPSELTARVRSACAGGPSPWS